MNTASISLTGKAGEAWDRVFGGPKFGKRAAQITAWATAPDDEKVDVVTSGGHLVEHTTVGSLRERGIL